MKVIIVNINTTSHSFIPYIQGGIEILKMLLRGGPKFPRGGYVRLGGEEAPRYHQHIHNFIVISNKLQCILMYRIIIGGEMLKLTVHMAYLKLLPQCKIEIFCRPFLRVGIEFVTIREGWVTS